MILLLTYLSFVLRAFCTADIPIRGIAVINGKDLDSAKSDSFIVYYGDSLMLECFLEDINNADIKESTDGYIENSYENIEWTLNGRLNNTWGTTLEFSYEELIRIGPKFLQFDCSKSEYGVYKFPLIRLGKSTTIIFNSQFKFFFLFEPKSNMKR